MKSRLPHYNFELYSLMANKYTHDLVLVLYRKKVKRCNKTYLYFPSLQQNKGKIREFQIYTFSMLRVKKKTSYPHKKEQNYTLSMLKVKKNVCNFIPARNTKKACQCIQNITVSIQYVCMTKLNSKNRIWKQSLEALRTIFLRNCKTAMRFPN